MTRTRTEIAEALELSRCGLNASQISGRLGVPRRTVCDWVNGRLPGRRTADRCQHCDHPPHDFGGLPREYVYLLGAYLGDGCISAHPKGVFRLRITLDQRYASILDEVEHAAARVMPGSAVGRVAREGCVDISSYSRAWPCLFPQHGPGKKHERDIALEGWQWNLVVREPKLLLRGLIHSDGCRFINTGRKWEHPRYVFSNTSEDIRRVFCDACDLLGLRWTTAPRTVYVSRKADVARMDEFIGPKA